MRFKYIKFLLLLPAVFWQLTAAAQNDAVAMAELAFARHAADSGIKKAFLCFLDSNSVVFHQGKVYNGIQFWKQLPANNGLLFWKPAYTGMALAGDMGFSTGPSEFKQAVSDTQVHSGNYASVWIKNNQGEWKVLADIGVSYRPSLFQQQSTAPAFHALSPVTEKKSWQLVEQNFIAQYIKKGTKAWEPFIGQATWFNIQNRHPLHKVAAIMAGVQTIPANLQFDVLGGCMSAAGDMCYAYGTVTYNGKKENYMRVWGHTKKGWILLLQALRW
jgi:hypothetical protein